MAFCIDTTRILFIGNSYTHYHHMPRTLSRMARFAKVKPILRPRQVSPGGVHLQTHWEETGALAQLRTARFDYVVIQDLSTGPLHSLERFKKYALLFAQEAKQLGTEPVFYQTWSRQAGHEVYKEAWSRGSVQAATDAVVKAYREISEQADAQVAPVGEAWMHALAAQGDLPLYDSDKHHPSPLGSYLAACMFYWVFVGEAPPEAYEAANVDQAQAAWVRKYVQNTWEQRGRSST